MKLFSNGMEQYLAIKSTLLREVTMSYMHLLIYLSLIDIYSSKRNECSVEHLFIFNLRVDRWCVSEPAFTWFGHIGQTSHIAHVI